ncbi:MAG: outer membrane lipoprotein carrier protein LolA [Acidobacteria bacterium]|nr:outer membrane lipoprotein carrier protein LolA [Acidobacteriota bacterium]
MRNVFLAAILVLCGPSLAAFAATVPDPSAPGLSDGERLEVLLERVRYEQEKMHSLSARFVMHQESELLLEPQESSGDFVYLAPDRVRWDYETPNPITVVIKGGEMTTWYHDLEKAEVAKVGRYSDRILKYMSASSSLGDLLEYFDARVSFKGPAGDPYRIELTPHYERVAKRLKKMVLWIDPQRYLPQRVRIEAADGDVSEFSFDHMQINADLAAGTFDLDLPAGVQVETVELGSGQG